MRLQQCPDDVPGSPGPPNYLGSLNPWTGQVTALTVGGVPFTPQGGLLFVGGRDGYGHECSESQALAAPGGRALTE